MANLEERHGAVLLDPILAMIPPHNFSPITFTFTYAALTTFILMIAPHPLTLIRGLQGYCLLLIFRTIAIYLVSLEPPIGMILLKDPVTILFMQTSTGGYIVKDLFFSGHVSAVVYFFFIVENKNAKKILFLFAIIIASLILMQHVHYTVDVLIAPFFSYLAYRITTAFNALFKKETAYSNL